MLLTEKDDHVFSREERLILKKAVLNQQPGYQNYSKFQLNMPLNYLLNLNAMMKLLFSYKL